MKKNLRRKFDGNEGITLVALVVTIIVLLILAGVALSSVLSQDGIFSRADQAVDKHGQAKARETLELALGEAQMQKYEQGLTDEQLTEKINAIGEELPKEKPEHPELQNVIVAGHIFEIDRSVPKIVDYIGPADGVIITAQITQNGDWKNPVATVTGTITKYGGGTVTSSTATATNGVTISSFPTAGGSFTIPNITTDTDITITASADDGKPAVTKTIQVRLVRDNTPPVISGQTATANLMKITIKANAVDNESGLQSLTYKIEPNTIKKAEDGTSRAEGTLVSGTPIEVEATAVGNYTVTFTATDNAGKTATATASPVRASDSISVADLKKKINADNYPDYIGTKVDYKPDDKVAWRVFYYDAGDADHPNGYFGDGAGTIYLKRDRDTTTRVYDHRNHTPSDGGALMRQLNPAWATSDNGKKSTTNWLMNEHCSSWLCDSSQWTRYKTSEAKYAIGAAPVEMWTKAHSAYIKKYEPSNSTIGCGIMNANGYGYTINNGALVDSSSTAVANKNIEQSKVIAADDQWLASPSSSNNAYYVCMVVWNRTYIQRL